MAGNDSGTYIVLVMLATVHFAYWAGKRWGGPFQWKHFGMALLPCVTCLAPYMAVSAMTPDDNFFGSVPWPMVVPTVGAVFLGTRSGSCFRAFVFSVGGFVVGTLLMSAASNAAQDSGYMLSRVTWEGRSPYDMVAQIQRLGEEVEPPLHRIRTPRPAGFVSNWATKLPQDYEFDANDRFLLARSTPLWHSWLTGIYVRHRQWYRMYTPGGLPSEMADGATLVAVDDQGKPLGGSNLAERPVNEFTLLVQDVAPP